ncbi:MAG: hypothetical protein DRG78_15310 [Epsilonproteobacteria bacterium]|nr:MAG: hypothetical protein DRG78_15310 [Campylobacterota bacterium]
MAYTLTKQKHQLCKDIINLVDCQNQFYPHIGPPLYLSLDGRKNISMSYRYEVEINIDFCELVYKELNIELKIKNVLYPRESDKFGIITLMNLSLSSLTQIKLTLL